MDNEPTIARVWRHGTDQRPAFCELLPRWTLVRCRELKLPTIAVTYPRQREIRVNEEFYDGVTSAQDAIAILAHECAHALTGTGCDDGAHGEQWARTCKQLGGNGQETLMMFLKDNPFTIDLRRITDAHPHIKDGEKLHMMAMDATIASGYTLTEVLEWYVASFRIWE